MRMILLILGTVIIIGGGLFWMTYESKLSLNIADSLAQINTVNRNIDEIYIIDSHDFLTVISKKKDLKDVNLFKITHEQFSLLNMGSRYLKQEPTKIKWKWIGVSTLGSQDIVLLFSEECDFIKIPELSIARKLNPEKQSILFNLLNKSELYQSD